jgi:phage terminase small subunit
MTPKQQRFAEEYVVDHNATQAAIRAGYSERTAKQQGSRLLTKVDVIEAVRAKKARLSRKIEVSISSQTEDMRENRDLALENKQAAAAQQCSMGIAKLHGLLVDRSEVKTTNDMTLAEVRARIKEIEAELDEASDAEQSPTQH